MRIFFPQLAAQESWATIGVLGCHRSLGLRPRNPRIPVPPRPDLAGKIAGIFPIPIWPGSGEFPGFQPRCRFGRDPWKSGNPDLAGIGEIAGICAPINRDQDRDLDSGFHFLVVHFWTCSHEMLGSPLWDNVGTEPQLALHHELGRRGGRGAGGLWRR